MIFFLPSSFPSGSYFISRSLKSLLSSWNLRLLKCLPAFYVDVPGTLLLKVSVPLEFWKIRPHSAIICGFCKVHLKHALKSELSWLVKFSLKWCHGQVLTRDPGNGMTETTCPGAWYQSHQRPPVVRILQASCVRVCFSFKVATRCMSDVSQSQSASKRGITQSESYEQPSFSSSGYFLTTKIFVESLRGFWERNTGTLLLLQRCGKGRGVLYL